MREATPSPEGRLEIETAESVAISHPLAGLGSRFAAVAVDHLIQGLLTAVALLALPSIDQLRRLIAGGAGWGLALLILTVFAVWFGYFILFEALQDGQTPGKRLLGLRVIAATGAPVSPLAAMLRNVLRLIDFTPSLYLIGILAVFLNSRHQRLGDMVAGTLVVREDRIATSELRRAGRPVEPGEAAGALRRMREDWGQEMAGALGARARRLDPAEAVLLERFLARRGRLAAQRREELGHAVARRLGLPAKAAADPERGLLALYALRSGEEGQETSRSSTGTPASRSFFR